MINLYVYIYFSIKSTENVLYCDTLLGSDMIYIGTWHDILELTPNPTKNLTSLLLLKWSKWTQVNPFVELNFQRGQVYVKLEISLWARQFQATGRRNMT